MREKCLRKVWKWLFASHRPAVSIIFCCLHCVNNENCTSYALFDCTFFSIYACNKSTWFLLRSGCATLSSNSAVELRRARGIEKGKTQCSDSLPLQINKNCLNKFLMRSSEKVSFCLVCCLYWTTCIQFFRVLFEFWIYIGKCVREASSAA